MHDAIICLEIDRNRDDASSLGIKINLGQLADPVPYDELVIGINLPKLMNDFGLDCLADIGDTVRIITPEEYADRYGNEEEELE